MIVLTRDGSQAVTLEGNEADLKALLKQIEQAVHPDQTAQVSVRVVDRNGNHLNLIIRKGKSKDSL